MTGRPKRRSTRTSVKVTEVVARVVIGIGGIGTTLAVAAISLFLIWVVVPLFRGATVDGARTELEAGASPLHLFVDEYDTMGGMVGDDGRLVVRRLEGGDVVRDEPVWSGESPTAYGFPSGVGDFAVGFADGSVRLGTLGFRVEFFEASDVPPEIGALELGRTAPWRGGIVESTPSGQWRWQTVEVALDEPLVAGAGSPIRLLDFARGPAGTTFATLDERERLSVVKVRERRNLLSGTLMKSAARLELPFEPDGERGPPAFLRVPDLGDQVYVAWRDGRLLRFEVPLEGEPRLAETIDLTPDSDATVTALDFLVGGATLLAGDSDGYVGAWFRIDDPEPAAVGAKKLVRAHLLESPGAAVTELAPSPRSRALAVGYADGRARVFQVTSEIMLAETEPEGGAIAKLVIAPKEDALLASRSGRLAHWDLDLGHPEANLASLFGPVWYEGYAEPSPYVWQSTGGTDDFEPKLGLRVLIFGTIKGTVYSMLFGAPIAILAALYTSEFLSARLRPSIKSLVELMAGLPSVVLGFLAGVVFAPFVQGNLAAILLVFLSVPFAILVGAQVWGLLPRRARVLLEGRPRLGAMALVVAVGGLLPLQFAPALEAVFFGGDVERWLDGQSGSGTPGWLLLFFPLAMLATGFACASFVDPRLKQLSAGRSAAFGNGLRVLRFAALALGSLGLAFGAAAGLTSVGVDPRESVMGTYIQRNTLVVGFIMGFAIIPIIYSLAEDALSSVPEHLRLASLGCGATAWQTAVRVVLPTAGSGIFSAVMIGLGRAVGETMIVLMATGNTPIRDWNLFNGFRTLSANIAVELPEAVHGDSHYRTLFLAAFTLFAMTFVLNTLAERLRSRSRARAFQL
jgi:phosphate transport system permease protein